MRCRLEMFFTNSNPRVVATNLAARSIDDLHCVHPPPMTPMLVCNHIIDIILANLW